MKIAVATSDDGRVTEHFGKAQRFQIYEFNGENVEFLGIRESKKDPDKKHQWNKSLKVIEDCEVIISLQSGVTAKPQLKKMGKTVLEDEGTVEEVIDRFIAHYKFMEKPLKF